MSDARRNKCPICAKQSIRRSHRRTVWDYLLSLVRLYPFRCEFCQHRFRAFVPWTVAARQAQNISTVSASFRWGMDRARFRPNNLV